MTIITDTFTETGSDVDLTSHTPDSGDSTGWTNPYTATVIGSSAGYVDGIAYAVANATISSADYWVTCTGNCSVSSNDNRFGILARWDTSTTTGYEFRLYGTGVYRLYRRLNSAYDATLVNSSTTITASADHDVKLQLETNGSQVDIKVWLNDMTEGNELIDISDTDANRILDSDPPGLYLEGGAETVSDFEADYLTAGSIIPQVAHHYRANSR